MERYYLKSIYSSQKDFYKKAYILTNEDFIKLYSYNTFILAIDRKNKRIIYSNYWDYSQTTLKHLKEFLQQNIGFFNHNNIIFKDFTKKEIEKTLKKYGIMEA